MEFTTVNVEARKNLDMKAGDTVRVGQKIQEKGKTRIQNFEGMVIARKHGTEQGATFIVRRVVNGMGVEKIFPLFSPMIDNIEIIKRGKTRRSKIYYVRDKAAKEISKRMRMIMMSIGLSDEEAKTKPAEDNTVVEENVTPTEEVAPATEDTSSETISDIAPETTSEDSDEGEKIEEKESEKTEDKKEETK